MRKFALVALCLGGLVACSDDDTTTPDAVVIPDAPVTFDAGPPDAKPNGPVADFDTCVNSSDCASNSDCVIIPNMGKECMPKCDTALPSGGGQDQCPVSTTCYPPGGGERTATWASLGNHCWFSFCGEDVGNGTTGGTCVMGAEVWFDTQEPGQDLHDGWCLPIDDGSWGQCLETGTATPGSTCGTTDERVPSDMCDANGLCVGPSTGPYTCAKLCDPSEILTGGNGGCTGTGEACYDASEVISYDDGSDARQTMGWCEGDSTSPLEACDTTDPTSCTTGGCSWTNNLRETGLCGGVGGVAVGGTCDMGASTNECVAGALCVGSVCRRYCDTDGAKVACTGTTATCWEPGKVCTPDLTTAATNDYYCTAPACDPELASDPACTGGTTCIYEGVHAFCVGGTDAGDLCAAGGTECGGTCVGGTAPAGTACNQSNAATVCTGGGTCSASCYLKVGYCRKVDCGASTPGHCASLYVDAGFDEIEETADDVYTGWGACFADVCGNSTVEPSEECDDGNTVDTDTCMACQTVPALLVATLTPAAPTVSLAGTATVTLTATLNRAAPTGGVAVAFVSGTPASVTLSAASVNIAAGDTTATVVATGIATGTSVISATFGTTAAATTTVTVNP